MILPLSSGRLWALIICVASTVPCIGVVGADDVQRITASGQQEMVAGTGMTSVGAKKPDVTIVEYFDYNCPYCKKIVPTLQELVAADHKVAVVYKEWPILGAVSVYAARAALAALWQGKYLPAHDALISGPRLAKNEQVDVLLQQAGLDMNQLNRDRALHSADIDALLTRSEEEAKALTLRGTPGLVVGRLLVPGIVDLRQLGELVAASRSGE